MEPATGMAAVYAAVTSAISQFITWMGTWITAITSNEILLFFCIALPIAFLGIAVIHKLISVRF